MPTTAWLVIRSYQTWDSIPLAVDVAVEWFVDHISSLSLETHKLLPEFSFQVTMIWRWCGKSTTFLSKRRFHCPSHFLSCHRLFYLKFDQQKFLITCWLKLSLRVWNVGQFIGFLVDQLARHRFLQVASHLERKTTSSAYELLRLVEADLQAYTQITSGRIVCFLTFLHGIMLLTSPCSMIKCARCMPMMVMSRRQSYRVTVRKYACSLWYLTQKKEEQKKLLKTGWINKLQRGS